jgi:hypothetical protein
MMLKQAMLLDALARHFPGLPIRAVAHHCLEAMNDATLRRQRRLLRAAMAGGAESWP